MTRSRLSISRLWRKFFCELDSKLFDKKEVMCFTGIMTEERRHFQIIREETSLAPLSEKSCGKLKSLQSGSSRNCKSYDVWEMAQSSNQFFGAFVKDRYLKE